MTLSVRNQRRALQLFIVCTSIAVLPSFGWAQRQSAAKQAQEPLQRVRSKAELRPKTDADRALARRFDAMGSVPLEPGLEITSGPGLGTAPPPDRPVPSYAEVVAAFVCRSEAVVVGRIESKRVGMNTKETFLYTDRVISVDRWIRSKSSRPATIHVVSAGGEVVIDGKLTRVVMGDPLEIKTPYLMFLQPLSGTPAFQFNARPVAPGPDWIAALSLSRIPTQLAAGTTTFEQFLNDLEVTGQSCPEQGQQ